MAELVLPTESVHASFMQAMDELLAEGRGAEGAGGDDSVLGRDLRALHPQWRDGSVFASYVQRLRAAATDSAALPEGWVLTTTYWWIEGETYLGRISLRHRLTERLFATGGHIGYEVRPSARRRGHATAMLRALLPPARALGISELLLTCRPDNLASRKVITACGGTCEGEKNGMLRFWMVVPPQPTRA